jgi:hypothetical protein
MASNYVSFSTTACAFARDGDRLFVVMSEPRDAGGSDGGDGDGGDGGALATIREILPSGELDTKAVVLSGAPIPVALALDADRFYVLGQGGAQPPSDATIRACPRSGGGACETLLPYASGHFIRTLARGAGRLYATDTGGRDVLSIGTTGDAGVVVVDHEPAYYPSEIVADDEALYFRALRDVSVDAGGALVRIARIALGDGAAPSAATSIAELDAATGLAIDHDDLVFGVTGAIALLPKEGGDTELIPIREAARVQFAAATEEHWFAFAETVSGLTLYVRPRCGGRSIAIAQVAAAGPPIQAAAFGSSVYFCSSGSIFFPATLNRVAF